MVGKYQDNYDWILFAWAIDLVRCVEDMPLWRKWLIRLALGKYAAREYVGLRDRLDETNGLVNAGYGLEGVEYHNEKWNWIYK